MRSINFKDTKYEKCLSCRNSDKEFRLCEGSKSYIELEDILNHLQEELV